MLTKKSSASLFVSKEVCVVFISFFLLATGNDLFELNCQNDYNQCTLVSQMGNELKVQNFKCIDEECKDTFLIASDDKWYVCETETKRNGKCTRLFKKNTLQLQSALLDLLIDNSGSIGSHINNINSGDVLEKRGLPFETLNYGRRKRYLPFETLNYGKRSAENTKCDCSQVQEQKRGLPYETMLYGKRALPYETMLYGKRGLPFETLNYGKRAYIPIDGYIMGKRQNKH